MKTALFILFFYIFIPKAYAQTSNEWHMVGANPQRTSWTNTESVSAGLNAPPVWYRTVESYIPQNVQIVTGNDLVYLATANGLLAFNADTGDLAWRFNTKLPLGNSPTVDGTVLYVGGYDKKLYCLNALNGILLWSYDGAMAGYDTNPLVVEGKVILGNRDGAIYVIGKHGTPQQGQLIWKFQTGGPIHLSAAYKDGVIYFASNDNYGYAVTVSNGQQVWKSVKLPGDGYQSYWPVIYTDTSVSPSRDYVIFSVSQAYRFEQNPGVESVKDSNGNAIDGGNRSLELNDLLLPGETQNTRTLIGPTGAPQSFSHDYPILDVSRFTEYLENNPDNDPTKHKPWRRLYVILNTADGSEYSFDSDNDGHGEYFPAVSWMTNNGSMYPPIVGQDNILYYSTVFATWYGQVLGWKFGTNYVSLDPAAFGTLPNRNAGDLADPQAISAGGKYIYRSLCCGRTGTYFDIYQRNASTFWGVLQLDDLAPGFNDYYGHNEWGWDYITWYRGNTQSTTGFYGTHGVRNPLVPYKNKVFSHQFNSIVAFGAGTQRGRLPTVAIEPPQTTVKILSSSDLQAKLTQEIQKMLDSWGGPGGPHLRPGYYNSRVGNNPDYLNDYFSNPGETLFTLSYAYPHLSPAQQSQVRTYLQEVISKWFYPTMYATTGWQGASREASVLPPEVEHEISTASTGLLSPQSVISYSRLGFSAYPPENIYALYTYAKNLNPANVSQLYSQAKSKLRVPLNAPSETDVLTKFPYYHNEWITGYIGFLKLGELAGFTDSFCLQNPSNSDCTSRNNVKTELNRLLSLRNTLFSKDSPVEWVDGAYHLKHFDVARNFMFINPDIALYFSAELTNKMREAQTFYEYIAPYWFSTRFDADIGETAMHNLYTPSASFLAKAWILKEPRDELTKYLDVPAFEKGDLFYIQNLVSAIEASSSTHCTPLGNIDCTGTVSVLDLSTLISNFGTNNFLSDLDDSGIVNILDLSILLSNFGK